jgi:hypothetical protein
MGPGCYPEAGPCDAITISGFVKDIISLLSVYRLLKMSAPHCECDSVDKWIQDWSSHCGHREGYAVSVVKDAQSGLGHSSWCFRRASSFHYQFQRWFTLMMKAARLHGQKTVILNKSGCGSCPGNTLVSWGVFVVFLPDICLLRPFQFTMERFITEN